MTTGGDIVHHVPSLIVLAATALALGSCGPPARERESTLGRWSFEMLDNDYAGAADLLLPSDRAAWLRQTEALSEKHGAVKSGQRGGAGHMDDASRLIVTWTDGTKSCLLVRGGRDGPIDILGDGYIDCDRLPKLETP